MACSRCGSDAPARDGRCSVCGRPVEDDSLTVAPGPPAAPTPDGPEAATVAPTAASPTGAGGPRGTLRIGQDFAARYHIIRLLGIGGMGAVYQAWDQTLEVAVALKVILPEATLDPLAAEQLEQRFKRELLLARQVTHRNVV